MGQPRPSNSTISLTLSFNTLFPRLPQPHKVHRRPAYPVISILLRPAMLLDAMGTLAQWLRCALANRTV